MKKHIFSLQADICRTLGNPKRLEIIDALCEKESTVTELAERAGIPNANVSQHLAVLRAKKLVTTRREGVNIFYSIANPKISTACNMMREVLFQQLQEGGMLAKNFKVK
jgi:ArsR family transcriptional regulator